MKTLFLLIILFSFNAQAIDYKQLKNCMTSLRWSPPQGKTNLNHIQEPIPDSHFMGEQTNGTQTSYMLNALLIPEKSATGTKLHVIQNPNVPTGEEKTSGRVSCQTGGIQKTFNIPRSAIDSRCSRKDSGGIAIAMGGYCHSNRYSLDMKPVKMTFAQTRGREETRICPNIFTNRETKTISGKQLNPDDVKKLVQNAILERLKFMAEQKQKGNIDIYKNNVVNAVKQGGYCEKAVSPTIDYAVASSALLCVVDPKQENGCLKGDVGPALGLPADAPKPVEK